MIIVARMFEKAMLMTKRPYTVGGTVAPAVKETIMACDGDIVMALFILIDKMEKFGWKYCMYGFVDTDIA